MSFSLSNLEPETAEVLRIIPDNVQNELIQIGANWRRDKFRIAELTMQMIKAVKDGRFYLFKNVEPGTRPGASVMGVYDAVSVLLGREVSPRTIRYWVQVIGVFTPEEVDKYHILPFDHFAVASHAEDPVAALELAMAQTIANHGVMPTSDWLATEIAAGDAPPEEPDYISLDLQADRIMQEGTDYITGHELVPLEPGPEVKEEIKAEIVGITQAFQRVWRVSGRALDKIRRGQLEDPGQASLVVEMLDKIVEVFESLFPGISDGLK